MLDVIVVGARVAGSATARLLAQQGHDVLVVDRATFPSDTISTHCIDNMGVQLLMNWDLLDDVLATNCPVIADIVLTAGEFELPGQLEVGLVAPRRTVLDKLLVDAARNAGAEVREGFTVKALLRDGDGRVSGVRGVDADGKEVEERAAVVIGADGVHSFVARDVESPQYDVRDGEGGGFYAYFRKTQFKAVELAFNDQNFAGVFPTNDDEVCVFAGRTKEHFAAMRSDPDRSHQETAAAASPRIGEWLAEGEKASRFYVWQALPAFFRVPAGPGWALVGDAGFHIDPVTGRGIGDAFRDAELLARGLHAAFTGATSMEDAMSTYQQTRDKMSQTMYRATQDIAALGWTNEELGGLFLEVGMEGERLRAEVAAWAEAPATQLL